MNCTADEYLWSDLSAATLGEATKQRSTSANDECQAQCAVLDMHRFGEISQDPRRIEVAAEELAPYVSEGAHTVTTRIERLLRAHADEWEAFRSAVGSESFLNRWLDILQ